MKNKSKYTNTSSKAIARKIKRFFKKEGKTPLYVEIVFEKKNPSREALMDIVSNYDI